MGQVLQQIKTRRSSRKYKPDEGPQELLDQIIEAGLYAASGKGQRSAIIIQVTNKERRDEISRMNAQIMDQSEGHDPFYGTPAMLKSLGVEGKYEGIGHCALGYIDGDVPEAAPRRENRAFYIK